jgi:ATP-binding cassette, subfamily F, member 3
VLNTNSKIHIGRFTQHHVDGLNLQQTVLEHMQSTFLNEDDSKLRGHLSGLGLSGELQLQPIYTLSGGQKVLHFTKLKSRLAFAKISYTKPHILLLDEPTNYLDIDTVDALILALNSYNGGYYFYFNLKELSLLVMINI